MNSALPQGWIQRRLRFDVVSNPKKSAITLPRDTEVTFIPMEAIGENGGMNTGRTRPIEEVYKDYTYFAEDDVCIARITPCFENGKGALAKELKEGIGFGTTELQILRARSTVDPKFLFYITMAHDFRQIAASEMLGAGGQKRVPESFVRDWRAPLPNVETQKRSAAHLDERVAQIDDLIDKKQQLLDRLAEKRQATITQTGTKGLNSNAPMRSSGIQWLGDVPAHWIIKPVKRIAKLESGHTPDKKVRSYWDGGDIPWVSLNDTARIRGADYIRETAFSITKAGLANSSARLLPKQAVVFTRDATIGEAAIAEVPVTVSQHIIAWICDQDILVREFLLFLVYGMKPELMRVTNGTTIGTIGMADVKAITIAVPPPTEQTKIVEHVKREKHRIEQASEKVEASIDLLVEYRAALITAAVTGQLDI